jgi:hypothetical protein
MKLRDLSDLFLYELWTFCDAEKQVMALLQRMSPLASCRDSEGIGKSGLRSYLIGDGRGSPNGKEPSSV